MNNDKQKQKQLRESVAAFAKSNNKKSLIQIATSFVPFFLLWVLAYKSLSISIVLSLAFSIVAAGFVVRIFILFHDCAHGSLFTNGRANRLVGTISGIITHFPFEKWRKEHAIHHATSGNLDKRGTGDIWVMTVEEYHKANVWRKISYRLYRNPFILFGLGPFYLFFVANRLNRKQANRTERWNTYVINAALVGIYALLCWAIGWQALVIVQLPIMFVAGSLGIWLFYVQHQFEDSYYENENEWDYVKAAIDGSSYYKLPKLLEWLTGNIGYHHVHHLAPRIPNYYLQEVHDTSPQLQTATTITLLSSFRSVRFRLYNEATKTFIGFKEYKQLQKKNSKQNIQLYAMRPKLENK